MNMTLAKKLFVVLVLALPVIVKANTEFKFTPRAKLEVQISSDELNRIEVNGGDIMEVVGDEGKYSLYWSSDWRNLFIKPKVPAGEPFELSLIFSGGLAQDIRFTAGDTTAKTIRLDLGKSETSKPSLQLKVTAMMKAMFEDKPRAEDVRGKYYITETNRVIKTTPQFQITQIKTYRYKDLNGAVAIVKNLSKATVQLSEEDFSRLFKDTLAITLKSFDLAPKAKTLLFIVTKGGSSDR